MTAAAARLEAPPVDIREVMTEPALFGETFGGDTRAAWRALLAGFYGLTLDRDEYRHWKSLTERPQPPQGAHEELWLAVGRRGGKSQCAALLAVYEAAFRDYTARLAPGEVATVMVLACDRQQARTVMRYISGLIEANPMLRRMVLREDRDSVELSNRTVIEVHTASFRSVRGYSVACCIADEIAFWRSEDSANPDHEIVAAIRPAMATLDGKLIALSSPYSKRGALWDAYRRYHGRDGPVLVAQAPSRTMNPSLPERVVNEALERDPEAAKAEYLAQFRSDLETFVSREVVEGCVVLGRHELPFIRPAKAPVNYRAFVDPSGGSNDAMTLAIGHDEGQTTVVDALREVKPPFSPETVVRDFAELLRDYRVTRVEGDRYGGEWPRERFDVHRITYEVAAKPRSDLYRDMLPLLNSGRLELPENNRLVAQLCSLERRTGRGGKDTIDHPPGSHDDLANAVAGLVAGNKGRRPTAGVW